MDFETEIQARELLLNYGFCWKLPPESLFHNDPKTTSFTISLEMFHMIQCSMTTTTRLFNYFETELVFNDVRITYLNTKKKYFKLNFAELCTHICAVL